MFLEIIRFIKYSIHSSLTRKEAKKKRKEKLPRLGFAEAFTGASIGVITGGERGGVVASTEKRRSDLRRAERDPLDRNVGKV